MSRSQPRSLSQQGSLLSETASAAALAGAVLFAVLAAFFLSGVILRRGATPDLPWLEAAGHWILDNGRLPASDPFSWTAYERPWVLYQWGFETAIAAVERAAGHAGLAVVFAWAALAIYLLAPIHAASARAPAPLAVAVAAAGLVIVSVNLSIRPMIATSAGLLVQHLLIGRLRERRIGPLAACLAIVLLYAVWANLHTGFAIGLLALLLALVGDSAERRFLPADVAPWAPPVPPGRLAALLGFATLGSAMTPYGPALHVYLVEMAGDAAINARIDELRGADFALLQFRLFLVLGILLIAASMRGRRVLRPADLLTCAVAMVATLMAARFVVWAALYFALLLPGALARAWPAVNLVAPRIDRPLILTLAAVSAMAPPLLAWRGLADPLGADCARLERAIRAYEAERLSSDRLLTDPVSGSCMISIAPDIRVFIDTRFDFYGGEFSTSALDLLALKRGWRAQLDHWRIDAAVLDRRRPLAEALAIDPHFLILYRDDEAVVVRRLHKGTDAPS
jgi:hypothetical protein